MGIVFAAHRLYMCFYAHAHAHAYDVQGHTHSQPGPIRRLEALSLSPDSPDAGLASFASAGSVLVLADPSVSPPALGRTLEAIQKKLAEKATMALRVGACG